SCIDCHIKGGNLADADEMLSDVRRAGISDKDLAPLEAQLASARHSNETDKKDGLPCAERRKKSPDKNKHQRQTVSREVPSQDMLDRLLFLYEAKQLPEAEALAISLTQDFPTHQAGWKVLGLTLKQMGRLDESLSPSYRSTHLSPSDAEAHNNLGGTLSEIGRFSDAAACFRKAITLEQDYIEAHYNLGLTLQKMDELALAAQNFRQVIALQENFLDSEELLLRCLYSQDPSSDFLNQLHYLINKKSVSAIVGSMVGRCKLKFGIQHANPFCEEPLKHVVHSDLAEHFHFKNTFISPVQRLISRHKFGDRFQSLLFNGRQTAGNVFAVEDEGLNEIQKIIRAEIQKYRSMFADSRDGLITQWPSSYRLDGWLVSMKSGGSLAPHIHERGWLSGSLYLHVPPKAGSDGGNLNVAIGMQSDAGETFMNEEETIDVRTGSLVLFPASVMHHTTPFQSEQDRVVLAFDMVPD
ncbi:MAG: tetratricopeptide repeat protein, partial [Halieaceae bacterium]|nr:tetratricopeptide repeat protein [Halieaceae bacterium]